MKAIYPGSFDPLTNGHLDIIERASKICDELYVAVLVNKNKKGLFTLEQRVEMIKGSVKHLNNVVVLSHEGLIYDLFKELKIHVIIKGVRNMVDFEYEHQLDSILKNIEPRVETLVLFSNSNHQHISSSMVKEIASFGGNINDFVPQSVINMFAKIQEE